MKTEQHTRPRPPQPQHELPATPSPNKPAPQLPPARRSERDIARLPFALENASPTLLADSALFSQLIQPVAHASDQDSSQGSSGLIPSALADIATAQLVDELAQRLPTAPSSPFNVSLLMPSLGRVQVRASKRDNRWDIELDFARHESFERVQARQDECESALASALAQPVNLTMSAEAAV